MLVPNIVDAVNAKLAGETLTFMQMRLFLDETIDDINNQLSSQFPDFGAYGMASNYDCFPDKYIRTVLVVGAAYKFYITDEEGTPTALQYQKDYANNLFLMKRDYSDKVPTQYQNWDQGYLTPLPETETTTTDPYGFYEW
jgi:hypothetical protein